MRLKFEFEKVDLDDQVVAVPLKTAGNDFQGILKLNETSVMILDMLKEDTTLEIIANKLGKEYGIPGEKLLGDIEKCIAELRDKGLLVE